MEDCFPIGAISPRWIHAGLFCNARSENRRSFGPCDVDSRLHSALAQGPFVFSQRFHMGWWRNVSRDHRLVVFDTPPVGAGPEYTQFRGYEIIRDLKTLPEKDMELVEVRFQPPSETRLPWPIKSDRITSPVLVRTKKSRFPDNYDYYDYVLQDGSGRDIDGAEEIVLANWAGWDAYGRLMVATGRELKIFELQRGKFTGKPIKTLDLEAMIA